MDGNDINATDENVFTGRGRKRWFRWISYWKEGWCKKKKRAIDGSIPFHIAVKNENKDCMKLLLEHGTKTYLKNHEGKTPLDYLQKKSCFTFGGMADGILAFSRFINNIVDIIRIFRN